ncbi:energy transducer TonB [Patescibacteria group bacterium]|nr:energy transducer TonB [Patescibacteria group bacterium]MBU1890508.1 energy transducer TonB [Patescibacteria group bacterium]
MSTRSSLVQAAHYRMKQWYGRTLAGAVIAAITLVVLTASFSPPYIETPYVLNEREIIEMVDVPSAIVIPPPPKTLAMPVLPQEFEIDPYADPDATILPTNFNPFNPPTLPTDGNHGQAPEDFYAFDTAPEVILSVPPVYPDMAREAGAEGRVEVRVRIDRDGRVTHATINKSEACELLESAAIEAAFQWLFKPALQRDVPVPVYIVIPFNFDLKQ